MPTPTSIPRPALLPLIAAFAAVYVIWGSTYLAIRVALDSIPPFAMASMRFLTAGTLLFVWARLAGAPMPRRLEWRGAALVGLPMLCMSHGGVVWAETRVASSLVAVVVGVGPIP